MSVTTNKNKLNNNKINPTVSKNNNKFVKNKITIPIDKMIENLLIEVPVPPRGIYRLEYSLNNQRRKLHQNEEIISLKNDNSVLNEEIISLKIQF